MININRHNYEEFFLLYADRELSAVNRMAVEQFVQENPDLAVELNLILDATLSADELMPMPEKESLIRNSSDEVHIGNYEEQFLLYIDQEMNEEERAEVERFVLQHPSLQESFMQLKQTVLPVEPIQFPNKATLYKQEEERRVVPIWFNWQRFTAAAVLTGLCFLTWTLLQKTDNTVTEAPTLAAASVKKTIQENERSTVQELEAANNQSVRNNAAPAKETLAGTGTTSFQQDSYKNIPQQQVTLNDVVAVNTNGREAASNSGITLGEEALQQQAVLSRNTVTENSVADRMANTRIQANTLAREEVLTLLNTDEEDLSRNNLAKQVVYKELDTEIDSDNKSLLVGSVELNRDKLRGFFRKAASIFRGKPKQEEEKEKATTAPSSRSLK